MGPEDPEPASVCKRNFWGLSYRRSSVIASVQEGPDRRCKADPLQQCASLGPGRHSKAGSLQQRVSGTAAIQEGPGRRSAAGALQNRLFDTLPRWEGPGRHSSAGVRRPKASLLAPLGQETIPEGASPSSSQDVLDELVEQPGLQHGSIAIKLQRVSRADGGELAQVEPGNIARESTAEAGRLAAEQQAGKQAHAQAQDERDAASGSHEDSFLQVSRLSALPCHAGSS